MNLKYFIDRPILSVVISVVIVLLGLIGLVSLPVEQYPDIAPPTVMVSTTYSGANAEAVQNSVIVPLEEAINGVENMTYMESSASNSGSASISIYFKQGTDPDMAADCLCPINAFRYIRIPDRNRYNIYLQFLGYRLRHSATADYRAISLAEIFLCPLDCSVV